MSGMLPRPPSADRVPVERRVVAAAVIGLLTLVALSAASWVTARSAEFHHERASVAVNSAAGLVTLVERSALDVNRLAGAEGLTAEDRQQLRTSIVVDARSVSSTATLLERGDRSVGLDGSLPPAVAELFTPAGGRVGQSVVEYAGVVEGVASAAGPAVDGAAVRSVNERQAALIPLLDRLVRELGVVDNRQMRHVRRLQLASLSAIGGVAVAEILLIFLPLARALGRQRQATGAAMTDARRRERELTVRVAEIEAIGEAVGAVLREEDARTAVVQVVHRLTGAAIVTLMEPTADGTQIVCTSSAGTDLVGLSMSADSRSLAARALAIGEPMFIPDVRRHPSTDVAMTKRLGELVGGTLTSAAYLPIVVDGRPVAELIVSFTDRRPGSEDVLPTLAVLASEAALAIRHQDLQRRLEELARRDPLTGLDNRRGWQDGLREALARAGRVGGPVCVAMLDLDHFKAYNDTHGHAGGDALLERVSLAWKERLRDGDVLARMGGEEFAVLLPGCELGAAVGVVESLRALVPFGQRCSAGLAEWDGQESPEALLAAADSALYAAKDAGRDQTHLRRSDGDLVAARDNRRETVDEVGSPV